MAARGGYFQAADGSKAADWELPVRTGKCGEPLAAGTWEPVEPNQILQQSVVARPEARYIDLDGEIHEVSSHLAAMSCWFSVIEVWV